MCSTVVVIRHCLSHFFYFKVVHAAAYYHVYIIYNSWVLLYNIISTAHAQSQFILMLHYCCWYCHCLILLDSFLFIVFVSYLILNVLIGIDAANSTVS